MRSYALYIDGEDRTTENWTYAARASELMANTVEAFDVKRALELNRMSAKDAPDYIFGRCAIGDARLGNEALEAAHRAKSVWGRSSLSTRREFGITLGDAIIERREELADIMVAEGHPRRLAEWEIRGMTSAMSEISVGWCISQMREEHQIGERRLVVARKPDGVVCLNPPQNAAGSNSGLGMLALMAGNTLVVKAPRSSPLSVMFLYREIVAAVLDRFEAPSGTMNLISGDTRQILKQWVESPLVNDIMFFGSSTRGLKLGQDCVAAGKKPILELEGNDCIVVWKDADLPAAATAICECFYGSSQICMVPKNAILHPEIAEEVIDLVLELVQEIRPGYPEDPDVVLSPVLKADRFFDFLSDAKQQGAEVLCGGGRVDVEGQPAPSGMFLQPTVIRVNGLSDARNLSCVREETFFPMLPVIVPFQNQIDLAGHIIKFLNDNLHGLRNSVWAQDPELIERFANEVNNGGLLRINESHIGFAPLLATHGGTGRTGGPFGEMHYPSLRTSHMQGIAISPHGSHTPEDLLEEISFQGTEQLGELELISTGAFTPRQPTRL
ncbi:MAG TPA: aldehyde dehydrogenase family protein [Solirubrobacteraceae bacterium]|jgi:acyl-CoA reductase-like NAD-dependent aldehyde dehydrogenase